MRISHKHKFVFLSKWKCGSESIREILNPYTDVFPSQKYPYYHHTTARLLKNHFDAQGWDWNEYVSFISIRNPWDMLISLYFYGLPDKSGQYYWERHWKDIENDIYLPRHRIVPDNIISFDNWIESYDLKRFTLDNFACDKKGQLLVDYIIKLENLHDDLNKLTNEIGINFEDIKIPHLNPSLHPDYQAFFSQKTAALVADIFKFDIEAGGYSFEKKRKRKAKTGPAVFDFSLFKYERDYLLNQLDAKILTFENEKLKLEKKTKASQEENEKLIHKLDAINKKQSEIVEECNQLSIREKEFVVENNKLESEIRILTNERMDLLNARDRLTAREAELGAENAKLQSELGNLAQERADLLDTRDRLTARETELVAENAKLQSEIGNLAQERADLLEERDDLKKGLRKVRGELDQMREHGSERERTLKILIATLNEYKLSARRNIFAKLPLVKKHLFSAKSQPNGADLDSGLLPHMSSSMQEDPKKNAGQNDDLEKRCENIQKSIILIERLRRQNERFLASKISRETSWAEISTKLTHDKKLKVVFINDMGFLYGAGIALRRQAESFMKAGHKVACVAWLPDNLNQSYFDDKPEYTECWQGMYLVPEISESAGKSREFVVDALTQAAMSRDPDLIISGNFHGVGWGARAWPLEVLENLHRRKVPVVVYAHDCYWATGACAYPGSCSNYLTGCDSQKCIKPEDQYPSCPLSEIKKNWEYRQSVFADPDPIPIATNSNWTTGFFRETYNRKGKIHTIHYGVNVELFKPIGKSKARDSLGVAKDGFYIALGAVNIAEDRKGGKDIKILLERYERHDDITWMTFGHNSHNIGTHSFGNVDEKKISLIFSAADIYVNLAKEEAFGQTLLEASACGCPLVTYNGGGMIDVARDMNNAICVETGNLDEIVIAIEQLRNAPELRNEMGVRGREIAVKEFSLEKQFENWCIFLKQLSN